MRTQKIIGFILASAMLVSSAAAPSRTPVSCPKRNASVSEQGFVRIGGIEQWVTIKGASCANPVVLLIHGGPGNPNTPFADNVYAGWDKRFTLVQWDQRGAGRTFGRGRDQSALSVDRMARDGLELAAYLTRRLGQRKLILVGSSWGSALAVHMAKARPELFHAYLGVSQLVDGKRNLAASYRRLVELARKAGDTRSLAALESAGPPPWTNPRSFGAIRRVSRLYEARTATPAPAGWWKPSPAYATEQALADAEAGEDFSYLQFVGPSGDGMLWALSLPKLGTRFRLPVYLVQGAEDLVTTPDVTKAWFDSISAPAKDYRLVPAAGHDPNAALIAAQYEILDTSIRPLAR